MHAHTYINSVVGQQEDFPQCTSLKHRAALVVDVGRFSFSAVCLLIYNFTQYHVPLRHSDVMN